MDKFKNQKFAKLTWEERRVRVCHFCLCIAYVERATVASMMLDNEEIAKKLVPGKKYWF